MSNLSFILMSSLTLWIGFLLIKLIHKFLEFQINALSGLRYRSKDILISNYRFWMRLEYIFILLRGSWLVRLLPLWQYIRRWRLTDNFFLIFCSKIVRESVGTLLFYFLLVKKCSLLVAFAIVVRWRVFLILVLAVAPLVDDVDNPLFLTLSCCPFLYGFCTLQIISDFLD